MLPSWTSPVLSGREPRGEAPAALGHSDEQVQKDILAARGVWTPIENYKSRHEGEEHARLPLHRLPFFSPSLSPGPARGMIHLSSPS